MMLLPDEDAQKALERLTQLNAERKRKHATELWDYPVPLREWEAHGLKCMIIRGPLSNINGYVIVDKAHPWDGLDYTDCPQSCGETWCQHSPGCQVEVHGGITWSSLVENGWVFGFDTAHSGDFVAMSSGMSDMDGRHWSEDDVAAETERMAGQLAKVAQDVG
jgi:hypothetical protein